jgi:hypothetical protein
LVRLSPLKIFRPKAKKSAFASAFQRPGSKCASVRAPNFTLFASVRQRASETDAPALGSQFLLPFQRWRSLSASEIDAPAKRMRQRRGADFCSLFKRSASAMDDIREAELPHCASALGPNSYYSPWFSPAHLLQRVSEPVPITVLDIATMSKPKLAPARLC